MTEVYLGRPISMDQDGPATGQMNWADDHFSSWTILVLQWWYITRTLLLFKSGRWEPCLAFSGVCLDCGLTTWNDSEESRETSWILKCWLSGIKMVGYTLTEISLKVSDKLRVHSIAGAQRSWSNYLAHLIILIGCWSIAPLLLFPCSQWVLEIIVECSCHRLPNIISLDWLDRKKWVRVAAERKALSGHIKVCYAT